MWGNLSQRVGAVAAAAKNVAGKVAAEAMETVQEIRQVHTVSDLSAAAFCFGELPLRSGGPFRPARPAESVWGRIRAPWCRWQQHHRSSPRRQGVLLPLFDV